MDPFTVIAIVQAGFAVYKLLSGGGNEAAKLQSLQIEMLRAISGQLTAVSRGIAQILDRLNDLESIVGNVPEKTVIEDYHSQILGAQIRFLQIAESYDETRRAEGIEAAQQQYSGLLLDEVIWPVHQANTNLTGYTNSLAAIPMVGIALWVQSTASIIANVDPDTIVPQLTHYKRWLEQALSNDNSNSVISVLEDTKRARLEQLRVISEIPAERSCFMHHQIRIDVVPMRLYADKNERTFRIGVNFADLGVAFIDAIAAYQKISGDPMDFQEAQFNVYSDVQVTGKEDISSDINALRAYADNNKCTPELLQSLSEATVKQKVGVFNSLNMQCLILASWRVAADAALHDCHSKLDAYTSL